MAISKIIYKSSTSAAGETWMDVTQKTVDAGNMLSGTTALKKDGTDVTGNIASMTLPSAASSTSSGTSKATITPTTSAQYLNIPAGYNDAAQFYTIGASSGSASVDTKTATLSAVSQSIEFTSLKGAPKYWFLRTTTQISSSGSTTIYYIIDARYNGTNTTGNSFRIGSTRRIYNVTSGISYSYSGTTLTITGGSSTGASPGQFYNGTYELVYIY